MKNAGQEIEAKFYVKDLAAIEQRLQSIGGELVSPRVKEINLRFDTPDGRMAIGRQALRSAHGYGCPPDLQRAAGCGGYGQQPARDRI